MRATPYSSKVSGTLPSDRLRPSNPRPSAPKPNKATQGKAVTESPKSDEVRQLEALLSGLRAPSAGQAQDPKGGCFCQARVHELSKYTPICFSCGLVLCALNTPYHACPSCARPLFTASAQSSLISQFESDLASILAKEADVRQRAAEAARQAAGAFPTLGGSTPSPSGTPARQPSPAGARVGDGGSVPKVLSLTAKRATVSVNALGRSPTPSRPASRASGADVDEQRRQREVLEMGSRIARPPTEVVFAPRKPAPERRWEDVRAAAPIFYVPLAAPDELKSKPASVKNKKGKAASTPHKTRRVDADAKSGKKSDKGKAPESARVQGSGSLAETPRVDAKGKAKLVWPGDTATEIQVDSD